MPICFPVPFFVFARETIRTCPLSIRRSGKLPASLAVGVGQDEDPSPAMARACFSRCEQARFWCVAQFAKASGDVGKSQIDVPFDIFEEGPFGPDLVNDAGDIGPEVAGIICTAALSGMAERLAGIAGRDDMNAVAPRAAIKGFEIVPNKRLSQGLVFHPGHESGRSMGFPLDISHSAISFFGDMEAEVQASISCTQRDSEQLGRNFGGI